MRKSIKLGLILFGILLFTTNVYAASCSMKMQTSKNEFKKDDEIVVDIAIDKIEAEPGIIALGATLEYNKDSLTLVEMKGQNNWSNPSYNETNGQFAMDAGTLVKNSETVLKIIFKVKDPNIQTSTITLKDIIVSGGIQTGDIPVATMTKTITIKTQTTEDDKNDNKDDNDKTNNDNTTDIDNTTTEGSNNGTNNNNPTSNNSSNPNTTTEESSNPTVIVNTNNSKEKDSLKKGILPKAGATNVILTILGVGIIITAILYIRMKIIDKQLK